MAPIEKNIIVTDKQGNQIGSTYPKRAKGLVKNGRAEYVSDCEIRLLFTQTPTVDIKTEETFMSEVINFNAREFRFDENGMKAWNGTQSEQCKNVGSRMFITTEFGNVEIFEIGTSGKDLSQIISEKKLERNTDYTFRFAIIGGCDTDNAVTEVIIYPVDRWEDKYVYPLEKSRYSPMVSKRDKNGLLRVFEIPFNTGEWEDYRILMIAQYTVARFLPARELTAYDKLEDLTYEQWYKEKRSPISKVPVQEIQQTLQQAAHSVKGGIQAGISGISGMMNAKNRSEKQDSSEDLSCVLAAGNGIYSEDQFAQLLIQVEDSYSVSFNNSNIYENEQEQENIPQVGDSADCLNLDASNSNLTNKAFSLLISKIGDNSNISLKNTAVNSGGLDHMAGVGSQADCCNYDLSNAILTAKAFSALLSKLGDSCNVTLENSVITSDGIDSMYSIESKVDCLNLDLKGTLIPGEVLDLIHHKAGDQCSINTLNIRLSKRV